MLSMDKQFNFYSAWIFRVIKRKGNINKNCILTERPYQTIRVDANVIQIGWIIRKVLEFVDFKVAILGAAILNI